MPNSIIEQLSDANAVYDAYSSELIIGFSSLQKIMDQIKVLKFTNNELTTIPESLLHPVDYDDTAKNLSNFVKLQQWQKKNLGLLETILTTIDYNTAHLHKFTLSNALDYFKPSDLIWVDNSAKTAVSNLLKTQGEGIIKNLQIKASISYLLKQFRFIEQRLLELEVFNQSEQTFEEKILKLTDLYKAYLADKTRIDSILNKTESIYMSKQISLDTYKSEPNDTSNNNTQDDRQQNLIIDTLADDPERSSINTQPSSVIDNLVTSQQKLINHRYIIFVDKNNKVLQSWPQTDLYNPKNINHEEIQDLVSKNITRILVYQPIYVSKTYNLTTYKIQNNSMSYRLNIKTVANSENLKLDPNTQKEVTKFIERALSLYQKFEHTINILQQEQCQLKPLDPILRQFNCDTSTDQNAQPSQAISALQQPKSI